MIATGLAVGILGALAVSKLLARFLFGISATDAFVFAALPLLLGLVALAATYVPARHAAKIEASAALRNE